jgi:hypothetical protein
MTVVLLTSSLVAMMPNSLAVAGSSLAFDADIHGWRAI